MCILKPKLGKIDCSTIVEISYHCPCVYLVIGIQYLIAAIHLSLYTISESNRVRKACLMYPTTMITSSIIYASSISSYPLSPVRIYNIISISQASIPLRSIGLSLSFPFSATVPDIFVILAKIYLTVSFF